MMSGGADDGIAY